MAHKSIFWVVILLVVTGCESLTQGLKERWEHAECMSQFAGHGYQSTRGIGINTVERPFERSCDWATSKEGKKYIADEEKRQTEVRKRKINKGLKQIIKDAKAKKEQEAWEQGEPGNE